MNIHRMILALLLVVLVVSYFINLSVVPLHLEEPRRALIALEMMYNGNFLVPTEMGVAYFKKPPFFNWLLVASFKLFGVSEFSARLVTIISMLGMGLATFAFVKKYVNRQVGVFAGLFVLISADLYFHFSQLAEIDVFYSLVVLLSFFGIYHFFEKKKWVVLFTVVYLLTSIGFLTKGLPSLVFTPISLLAWFIYKRKFMMLISWQHALGIIIFALTAGGYFLAYSQYNDPSGFVNDLWSQSSERTLIEKSAMDFVKHVFSFPLTILKDILPASLFLIFLFDKDVRARWWKNDVVRFCIILFAANIIVYWVSPGARTRYIYMLYPLLIVPMTQLALLGYTAKLRKLADWILGVLIGLAFAAVLLLNLRSDLFVTNILLPSVLASIALGSLLILYLRKQNFRVLILIGSIVVLRVLFDVIVLPTRALEGDIAKDYSSAMTLVELSKGEDLHIYRGNSDGFFPLETVFYVEKERGHTLQSTLDKNCDDYFISFENRLRGEEYEVYHEVEWRHTKYFLLKFTECP